MKILALEFSADLRSAAVFNGVTAPACVCEPVECGPIQMIERALDQAGCEREAVDTIAVGLGPGSYSGIRTAIAMAQGWQLARPVRLLGLSSIDVLAAEARNDGIRGNVSVVVDAQRGELYWARYSISSAGYEPVQSLRLATWEQVEPLMREGEPVIGPHRALAERGVKLVVPKAATLAILAADRHENVAPETLEPIYLRTTSFVKAPPVRPIPPVKRNE